MEIFGPLLGLLFTGTLIYLFVSDTVNARKRNFESIRAYELKDKLFHQQFILAGKILIPESKITYNGGNIDLSSALKGAGGKKIGTLVIHGYKLFNSYELKITVNALENRFIEVNNSVDDNFDDLKEAMGIQLKKLFSNELLVKIIFSTTY